LNTKKYYIVNRLNLPGRLTENADALHGDRRKKNRQLLVSR